jgi:hypothetical protein
MKSTTIKRAISAILLIILCTIAGIAIVRANAASAGSEDSKYFGFYRLSPEMESEARRVVLADSRLQGLIAERDLDYRINVGAVLKEDVEHEELLEWLRGGRKDTSAISEIVGVLSIGYNDSYALDIDMEKEKVVSIKERIQVGPRIPEVTRTEKQKALDTAMADSRVQGLLANKGYEVAPDGQIGVWHTSDMKKLGVVIVVRFSQPYIIEYDWPDAEVSFDKDGGPLYHVETRREAREVEFVMIKVDLSGDNVVAIEPIGQQVESAAEGGNKS